MKPLKVALVVKARDAALERDNRAMGYFSYAVPEFEWSHFPQPKQFILDTHDIARQGFDLIVHEDFPHGTYIGHHVPIVYLAIDSTLSNDHHYLPRLKTATQSDLILVDHDDLARFAIKGKSVRRLSYCVNDLVFRDYQLERTAEVVMHNNSGKAAPSQARSDLRSQLHTLCQQNGWRYRSGMLPLVEYARSMNAAKVTVNWPRTPANRPHRVFDSLACRTCLLTGPLPDVSDEFRLSGSHYLTFCDQAELAEWLSLIFRSDDDLWDYFANSGYEMVMKHHTWSQRARELRELLQVELGL